MTAISPQKLGELLETHGAGLVLYARQWCRSPEDVVQEAFVELLRQPSLPQPTAPWLFRVARHRAFNAARARGRRERYESMAHADRPAWFHDDLAQQLDARQVTQELEHLPAEEREVIVARIWGGLSFEAVGNLMGASTSTTFRRYQAGLRSLRAKLEETCPKSTSVKT